MGADDPANQTPTPRRLLRPRVLLAAALAALVVVLALVLTHSASRATYDNDRLVERGVVLRPGQEACQAHEFVPAGSPKLRMWVSTAGRPGGLLRLSVRDGSRVLSQGRTIQAYNDSPVYLSLAALRRERRDAEVCVRNASPIQVAVMGSLVQDATAEAARANALLGRSGKPFSATVGGKPYFEAIRMRMEWHRPGTDSWLALAPTVAARASYGRASWMGAWTLWAALGLSVAGALAALTAFARELPR